MEAKLLLCGVLLLVFSAPGSKAQSNECGVAPLNNRIVGGQDAPAGAWPWQVSLHTRLGHFCGGSLINREWVVSAAHCFNRVGSSEVIIYLGRQTQQLQNLNEVSRRASQLIIHPDYDEAQSDNDIALLRLSPLVSFTDFIRPVCLAASDSNFPAGTNSWVTGWGTIQENGQPLPFPQRLQEVTVPIVSNAQCNRAYGTITENMICAGLTEGGRDSCQGDSGGPMVVKSGPTWFLVGVVSFGRGCAQPGFPGVYARVSRFQAWINSQIDGNQGNGSTSGADHLVSLLVLWALLYVFS